MSDGETAAAGWYAHPSMADTQQYWDGQRWTENVAPGQPQHVVQQAAQAAGEEDHSRLTAVGFLLAAILPIGGFIVGCILLGKNAIKAGVVIMLVSVVAGVIWFNVVSDWQHDRCVRDNVDRSISGQPTRDCG